MTLDIFYRLLSQAVEYFPKADDKSDQLQTMAVLRFREELNHSNLSKNVDYKNTNYFFSRAWKALKYNASNIIFEYPLLCVFPISASASGLFSPQGGKVSYSMELNFLYPNLSKTDTTSELHRRCKVLLVEDIYAKMLDQAIAVIGFLKDVKYYNTNIGGAYYHKDIVAAAITAGDLESAVIENTRTTRFQRQLRTNENIDIAYVDDQGQDKLCGVKLRINSIEFSCTPRAALTPADVSGCCTEADDPKI